MEKLPDDFIKRMREILEPADLDRYLSALEFPPMRFARVNPLKVADESMIADELGGFPILPEGAKPGLGSLHAAGAYYVQEPAAAQVAGLIIPFLPEGARVLDACAAPGGKVTAAACARPDCTFVANDPVFSRAKILLSNVERMGLRNCTVTSLRPDEIARRAPGLFDAVIADVPCSGEGMLRKADFAAADLSDRAVEACAARAALILEECDRCLRPGGILSFSTCTFSTGENERQVQKLIREKGYTPIEPTVRPPCSRRGYGLPEAVRFFPQDGGGEGHFCCLLRKPDAPARAVRINPPVEKSASARKKIQSAQTLAAQFTREQFPADRIILLGEGCELLPENYAYAELPALRRGMRLCDFAGDRAEPHHHAASAARADLLIDSPDYAPRSPEIAAYLSGAEFDCDAPSGFRVLRVASLPLGFIKVSGGRAKNRYPKGLRSHNPSFR